MANLINPHKKSSKCPALKDLWTPLWKVLELPQCFLILLKLPLLIHKKLFTIFVKRNNQLVDPTKKEKKKKIF